MKSIKFVMFLFTMYTLNVFSQNQNVISNGGNYQESTGGSLTWTIGEVVINTLESTDVHVTQGFNQDWLNFLNIEVFSEKINVTVYPNPTTEFINIESDKKSDLAIYDASGKLVGQYKVNKTDQIDLSELSGGIYYLNFSRKNAKIKTIKIIIQ